MVSHVRKGLNLYPKKIAVKNAIRMMKESGADAVKMQGGKEMFEIIKAIADSGVPVMSHVGLTPHFVHRLGGFKMQGKTADEAIRIIENAKAIEKAGAIGIEIEAVPDEVAKAIDNAVSIFTRFSQIIILRPRLRRHRRQSFFW